jgi:hypothetical protein
MVTNWDKALLENVAKGSQKTPRFIAALINTHYVEEEDISNMDPGVKSTGGAKAAKGAPASS